MKTVIIITMLINRLLNLYSQQGMDVEDAINNNSVNKWVDESFKKDVPTVMEKLEGKHPFLFINTNRKLAISPDFITCFGVNLYDAYAYRDETNQFALFLLLKSDQSTLQKLIEKLGYPANITRESLEAGDYDFLAWHVPGGINIVYQRNRTENNKWEVKSQLLFDVYTLEIYNMPREVFSQQEGIEDE